MMKIKNTIQLLSVSGCVYLIQFSIVDEDVFFSYSHHVSVTKRLTNLIHAETHYALSNPHPYKILYLFVRVLKFTFKNKLMTSNRKPSTPKSIQ